MDVCGLCDHNPERLVGTLGDEHPRARRPPTATRPKERSSVPNPHRSSLSGLVGQRQSLASVLHVTPPPDKESSSEGKVL